jgi:hypothetical protein
MFVLKFTAAARQTFDRTSPTACRRGFRVRAFLEFGALPAIADRYAEGGRLLGLPE